MAQPYFACVFVSGKEFPYWRAASPARQVGRPSGAEVASKRAQWLPPCQFWRSFQLAFALFAFEQFVRGVACANVQHDHAPVSVVAK
jgi:hypothetical protein